MPYLRLNKIVSFIKKDEKILDVGTDHCLVPIFLLKQKVTTNIYASDISQNSIDTSRQNLVKHGLEEDSVKLILSDGLEKIDNPNFFNVIIVAGLGGTTIANIIKQKKFKRPRLILHATNGHDKIRKALVNKGYKITNEEMVYENDVFNIIIVAERNTFNSWISKKNQYLGPLLKLNKDDNVLKYYQGLFNKNKMIVEKSGKKSYAKKNKWLSEVLNNEKR